MNKKKEEKNSVEKILNLSKQEDKDTMFNNKEIVEYHNNTEIQTQVSTVKSADEDFEFARTALKDMISFGAESAYEARKIAETQMSSNGFSTVAQIIKSVTDASKELMNLSKTRNDVVGSQETQEPTINIEQGVFVGSPKDLLAMRKQKNG